VNETRIGLGYDMHAFGPDRRLMLGGVDVPCERGLEGHSDADVLVHALMDAILGAMRAGDIGAHFPDTDPAYAGCSSIGLLERVGAMMREAGWRLVDADTVLVLESPKIAPYRDEMRAHMAAALGIEIDHVGLKATTTEGLGAVGRGEGAAAQAVVLLERGTRVV
jgi:2-C-methyl-D-erythritol 2,4-cyclodiphosphate synthase